MDVRAVAMANLAELVVATAGRPGEVARVPGGVAVASPIPVAHGFVTAAFRLDPAVAAEEFLDAAFAFFAERDRAWVVWVGDHQPDLADAVVERGGILEGPGSPVMVARGPVSVPEGFVVSAVSSPEEGKVFAGLAEAGYEMEGMAWLMGEHDAWAAPGSTWMLVTPADDPDGGPISVAAGYRHGATAGVYYVATPPGHRGRGGGAAVTAAVTNHLIEGGAELVTLQATDLGDPVYRRLGYDQVGAVWSCELPAR